MESWLVLVGRADVEEGQSLGFWGSNYSNLPQRGDAEDRVGSLIDQDTHEWNAVKVKVMFDKREASMILGMPISKMGCPDRLIWHFSKKGLYAAKSGYQYDMQRNGN
ncbi:hypothetical protein GBA52_024465 [Prunus armeniaca]|nr:hypothetical protein GBA52_024465 [Prunus armeniaca]